MKTRKKLLIPLLMLSPLLMANAPVPHVEPDEYKALTCSFKERTQEIDSESHIYYSYKFDVSNTGNGYIEHLHISYPDMSFYSYANSEECPFGKEVIAPGTSRVLSIGTTIEDDFSSQTFTYTASAYQRFVDNAFSSDRKDIRVENESGYYKYYVDFDSKVNVRANEDYEFGIIITITYKGVTYVTHHELNDNNTLYLCNSEEELDLSQLTIDEMIMTKGDAYKSPIAIVVTVILVILAVGGAFLVGGLIFICIFFPIKAYRKKKRLANNS